MNSKQYQNLEEFLPKIGLRERLAEFGPSSLKEYELLAVLFGTGYKGENVIELSRRVLADYGSKAILKARSQAEVMEITGLPNVKACQLLATLELGRRFFAPENLDFPTIRSPEDAAKIFEHLGAARRETVEAAYLSAQNKVMHREIIAIGSPFAAGIDVAEIFAPAIGLRAAGVILAHNHPTGELSVSPADLAATNEIQRAGELLRRPLLDHLIIGKNGEFRSILHGE